MVGNSRAQQWLLKAAVGTLRDGNHVRGRDLLLRVIQQNRDVEAAWWWQYQALDDAPGQTRALQNVPRLHPQHAEAQQELIDQRHNRIGADKQTDWASLLPEAVLEAQDGLDDFYQCPYCGQPTGINDRRCPHCRGGLYAWVARSGGSAGLRLVLPLIGISLAAGLIEMLGPVFALGVAQGTADETAFQPLLGFAIVPVFLGHFLQRSPPVARLLLEIYLARAGVLATILLSLRAHWSLGFYSALIGIAGDLLLSAYLLISAYLAVAGAVLNGALALAIGALLFGLSDEFAVNSVRVLVKPDTGARSALDFYKLGPHYRQRRMWAMAVAQWRKAVGLAPQVPQYYKHLGIGYAQIKRFSHSLRALEQGRRQAPDDKEIAEVTALVKSQADRHALLER
jgi:tetratricopeptide (TPR) repeat protein